MRTKGRREVAHKHHLDFLRPEKTVGTGSVSDLSLWNAEGALFGPNLEVHHSVTCAVLPLSGLYPSGVSGRSAGVSAGGRLYTGAACVWNWPGAKPAWQLRFSQQLMFDLSGNCQMQNVNQCACCRYSYTLVYWII